MKKVDEALTQSQEQMTHRQSLLESGRVRIQKETSREPAPKQDERQGTATVQRRSK